MASTPLQYRSHIERNFGWPAQVSVVTSDHSSTKHTSHVPNLERNVSFSYFAEVKSDCGDNILAPLAQHGGVREVRGVMGGGNLTWPEVITLTKDVFPEAFPVG